jgi:hypothetical protein
MESPENCTHAEVDRFHPPTQVTMALAVEECITPGGIASALHPHALADFAHWRMTHRSLGVGGYGYWGPRACPWGSIGKNLLVKEAIVRRGFRGR